MNHTKVIKLVAKESGYKQKEIKAIFETYEKVLIKVLEHNENYLWRGMFNIQIKPNLQGRNSHYRTTFKPNTTKLKFTPGSYLVRAIGMISESDKRKYYKLREKLTKKQPRQPKD